MAPRPFRIEVPDAVLDDLRERLARTRWPEPMNDDAGWDDGADVAYLRELCDYWRDGYDWRAWEARLNELPGFRAEVDGVDLHFWHVRGAGPTPLPLLLVHGWPGSIVEFLDLVGPLTDPARTAATRPTPSTWSCPRCPGFGFGGAPRERGWGVSRISAAFDTLMSASSATSATASRAATGADGRREARRHAPRPRRRDPRELRDGAAAARRPARRTPRRCSG